MFTVRKTHIAEMLENADRYIQYDEHVKRILSNRYILAHILKEVTEECSELSIEEIVSCIGEDVMISDVALKPGETNNPRYQNSCLKTDSIIGDNVENKIPYEGMILYDIRFSLKIKNDWKAIKLLFNIEAQKDSSKPYDLETRGIFYGARMLSAQIDTEFALPDYQNLKKVYSIWVCMNAPEYIGNVISDYRIKKRNIIGNIPDRKKSYDKLTVILIYLNKKKISEERNLLRLLNVLLSTTISADKKEKILQEEYHIDTECELGKEISEMCNLGEGIAEQAIMEGMAQGIEQGMNQGEGCFAELTRQLLLQHRTQELMKATIDQNYRHQLYLEFGIQKWQSKK